MATTQPPLTPITPDSGEIKGGKGLPDTTVKQYDKVELFPPVFCRAFIFLKFSSARTPRLSGNDREWAGAYFARGLI